MLRVLARSLPALVLALLALFATVGIVASKVMASRRTPEEQATLATRAGRLDEAEVIYLSLVRRGRATVPLVIALVEVAASRAPFASGDEDVDALLAGDELPPDVALLGRYWRDVITGERSGTRAQVLAAADATPPMAWANHLIAREAERDAKPLDAAARYEREGKSFPERASDIDRGIRLYIAGDDWDSVEALLEDPATSRLVGAGIRRDYAVHVRDWLGAIRWTLPSLYAGIATGPLVLAAVSALAWFWFCARIGKITERPKLRVPLYVGAFVLGVLSVYLTLALVVVEENVLHFTEKGKPLADVIYFVLGVGLREELSKLILFLPLLPILKRHGTAREVLACGALVGLGFAAEENVSSYFAHGDLTVAMARFLTANFLHISCTAIVALAVFELAKKPEEGVTILSRAFLTVIAIHGAWDFFLSFPEVADFAFLSMAVFAILARLFMNAIKSLHGSEGRGAPLLVRFVLALTIIIGASFVYAAILVGPGAAAKAMIEGLIGVAIIVFMMVQELALL